jgi:hypothetical protein
MYLKVSYVRVLTAIVFKESVTLYYINISRSGAVSCGFEIIKSQYSKVLNVKRLKSKGTCLEIL